MVFTVHEDRQRKLLGNGTNDIFGGILHPKEWATGTRYVCIIEFLKLRR